MFFADFHIHSHFSRATSKDLTIPNIAKWAMKKGIGIVGTGDITHQGWIAEVRENLEEEGNGLLRLKKSVFSEIKSHLPASLHSDVRFIISTEVSSIFKKGGRVRKVHSVIFFPNLDSAENFSARLSRFGNISSDGRPILGVAPKDLLILAKMAHPNAFMIPAHIWTPHFSLFGAMSGFDSIEECFEEVTEEIFALETGLSSDPAMNRRWSKLDRFSLVSCSDAHSPSRIGREATIFNKEVDYLGIISALKGDGNLLGTVEFYPEEGKYHLDGHRKCGIRLMPEETRRLEGRCPVCKGTVTPGVLGRVEFLADRDIPASGFPPQYNLVPLQELIAECLSNNVQSKKVEDEYEKTLANFGPELPLLGWVDLESVTLSPILCEAIKRVREGRVILKGGYDGEYGLVKVFDPLEIETFRGQSVMFTLSTCKYPSTDATKGTREPSQPTIHDLLRIEEDFLTDEQRSAAQAKEKIVVVMAGPGTGKTKTLVSRAQYLIQTGVNPHKILILTFTNKAVGEIRDRLRKSCNVCPHISTFHSFALGELCSLQDFSNIRIVAKNQIERGELDITLDEIVPRFIERLKKDNALFERLCERFDHILVDEFQDISPDQYELLKILRPRGMPIFVVGDPDQTIYGFRGSDPNIFARFIQDFQGATSYQLTITHRLTPEIVEFSKLFSIRPRIVSKRSHNEQVRIYLARNFADEAKFVVEKIKDLMGGLEMHEGREGRSGLADIAILGRTHQVVERIGHALSDAGIPLSLASDRLLSDSKFMRVLIEGLEKTQWEGDIMEMCQRIMRDANLEVDKNMLRNLVRVIEAEDKNTVLRRLSLLREVDALEISPERVACLTIHAAKGLEFDHVFIVGCEDGVFPVTSHDSDQEEERRLMYVAATRPKQTLYITGPKNNLSRFLQDIPEGIAIKESFKMKPFQLALF